VPYELEFPRLSSRKALFRFLGLTQEDAANFDWVLDFEPPGDDEPDPMVMIGDELERAPAPFWRHRIEKRNKARGFRTVWEPMVLTSQYKALARRLGYYLRARLDDFPHPNTFGYLGGRNIRGNALGHCGRKHLLSTDLTDFFPTITRERVEQLFLDVGMVAEVADLLSRFVTIGGRLPLGLPTSPVLSNAIFLPADIQLTALALAEDAVYSRYADDMSFSSDTKPFNVDIVETCVADHGFTLAHGKTRRSKLGQAQYVTGLSVSDPDGPHAPKRMKRRLRQELYYARKHGLGGHLARLGYEDKTAIQQQINRLDGTVMYVAHQEPRQASVLRTQWSQVLTTSNHRAGFTPRTQGSCDFHICIDEAEFKDPKGDVFLALAMSVSQHQEQLQDDIEHALEDWLSDLFEAGDRNAIAKKGLHYTDAHPDLRRDFIRQMAAMPFEGYVTLDRLQSPKAYEMTYLRLIKSLMRRRLMAAQGRRAIVLIEENSKVKKAKVKATIQGVFAELKAENNRCPGTMEVDFISKPHPAVSLPDFLLGALVHYLKSKPAEDGDSERRERQLFERIRDKYRVILDLDSGVEYSRRRAIAPWTP
jgi:RNA-directed DNA polymerase